MRSDKPFVGVSLFNIHGIELCVEVYVSDSPASQGVWRFLTLLLWFLFFVAGLFPEILFYALRQAGAVVPQYAIINSPQAITVGFAAYLAVFCLNRCRDAGLSIAASQDRALFVGILGLPAFLPVDFLYIVQLYLNPETQGRLFTYLNYGAAAVKIGAWWYLLSVLVRYYAFGMDAAFSDLPTIFPSSYRPDSYRPDSHRADSHRADSMASVPTTDNVPALHNVPAEDNLLRATSVPKGEGPFEEAPRPSDADRRE